MRDLYCTVLGKSRSSTSNGIKQAYRCITTECHPDRNSECQIKDSSLKEMPKPYNKMLHPNIRGSFDNALNSSRASCLPNNQNASSKMNLQNYRSVHTSSSSGCDMCTNRMCYGNGVTVKEHVMAGLCVQSNRAPGASHFYSTQTSINLEKAAEKGKYEIADKSRKYVDNIRHREMRGNQVAIDRLNERRNERKSEQKKHDSAIRSEQKKQEKESAVGNYRAFTNPNSKDDSAASKDTGCSIM